MISDASIVSHGPLFLKIEEARWRQPRTDVRTHDIRRSLGIPPPKRFTSRWRMMRRLFHA